MEILKDLGGLIRTEVPAEACNVDDCRRGSRKYSCHM